MSRWRVPVEFHVEADSREEAIELVRQNQDAQGPVTQWEFDESDTYAEGEPAGVPLEFHKWAGIEPGPSCPCPNCQRQRLHAT